MGGWSLSLTFTPKDNSELPIILTGGSQSTWRNSLQMKKTNQEVRIRNLWGKCANHGAIMLHNHVSAIHNYYLGLNVRKILNIYIHETIPPLVTGTDCGCASTPLVPQHNF